MPVYALMTWVLFLDIKKLNFTEHLVANAYTTAQVSFVQVVISIPLFGFFNINYQNFNWLLLLFSVSFQFYAFKKLHKVGVFNIVLRAIAYLVMFAFVMLGIGFLILIIGLLTGTMNLEDFRPK